MLTTKYVVSKNSKGGEKMKDIMPKNACREVAYIPNELVKFLDAATTEDLEDMINDFIMTEKVWIKEIRPVAYTGTSCAKDVNSEAVKWDYFTRFGVIIRYEPRAGQENFIEPGCKLCGAKESERHGRWIDDQFYCMECIREKLNS